jgi:hypothetical protein
MPKNFKDNNNIAYNNLRSFLYVWIAGFIGFIFYIPAIPKLIPAHVRLQFSMNTLIILSILQSVIFTAIFAAAGAILAPRIGFRAYLADVPIKKKVFWIVLKRQFFYGATIGLAGSIIAYFIAPDFIAYLNLYPFLSRLFGGLTEEVIMRWGFMTIIIWILWRIFQHGIGIPKELLIWSGILLSQILFAIGHIPTLIKFGITNPVWCACTIFIVSLPWGWLFWKHGLESAFIAHASFHAFTAFFVAVKL